MKPFPPRADGPLLPGKPRQSVPDFLPVNGNQQQLIQPSFSTLGRIFDEAFNRSDTMSTRYTSTFNDFEINYRIDGHNHVDQMVLNPNGRWYRECQSGYYYSYFFGMKGMFIDESFDFASSGAQYTAVTPGQAPEFTHAGNYSVHTSNALLGFQSGGNSSGVFAAGASMRTAMPGCS